MFAGLVIDKQFKYGIYHGKPMQHQGTCHFLLSG